MARPGTGTNPSEFEEELAAVAQSDQQALGETAELERQYELEEAANQERHEARLAQRAQQIAKNRAKQLAGEVAKKQLKRGAVWLGRSAVVTGAGGILSTLALILAGLCLVILMVVGALYYSCSYPGIMGYVTAGISKLAHVMGATDFDVCSAFVTTTEERVVTDAESENISRDTEGDAAARAFLLMNNVGVNAPAPQTDLENILQATLEEVVRIKSSCDNWASYQDPPRAPDPADANTPPNRAPADSYCNVVVTGATEQGHATTGRCIHESGFKIDLRLTPNLNAFIMENYPEIAPRGADRRWLNNSTNTVYVLESDHWDISVGCA